MRRSQKGYSLTELLLVLGILGIALAISIPALGQYMRSYSARVGADEFVSHMRLARHLAIARHQPVTFTSTADGYSLPDWQAQDLATANPRTYELPRGCTLVSGAGDVTFRSDGTVSTGATTMRIQIDLNGETTGRYDIGISNAGQVKATYTKVSS